MDTLNNDKMPTLTIGKTGRAVRKVQEFLNKLGYEITADGDFGAKTEAAVKDFQENNGMEVTGYVDRDTKQAIKRAAKRGDVPQKRPAETRLFRQMPNSFHLPQARLMWRLLRSSFARSRGPKMRLQNFAALSARAAAWFSLSTSVRRVCSECCSTCSISRPSR